MESAQHFGEIGCLNFIVKKEAEHNTTEEGGRLTF
jgi:hypothetical protein